MLLFKAKFRDALLSGAKTTTLRSWKSRRVRPNTIRKTNLGILLFIHSVETIQLVDITDDHARNDGFSDRESLMAELRAIYPFLPETLTLITFSLYKPQTV
jgi:hypothetical protein